jgi:hypothetical protein
MTQESYSTYTVRDTLLGVVGAAAGLAGIGESITETAREPINSAEHLKLTARTIQSAALRGALACMSLAAHAGRLEAFAHGALVVEARDEGARVARVSVRRSSRPAPADSVAPNAVSSDDPRSEKGGRE